MVQAKKAALKGRLFYWVACCVGWVGFINPALRYESEALG
jgi:hypothetical protein